MKIRVKRAVSRVYGYGGKGTFDLVSLLEDGMFVISVAKEGSEKEDVIFDREGLMKIKMVIDDTYNELVKREVIHYV